MKGSGKHDRSARAAEQLMKSLRARSARLLAEAHGVRSVEAATDEAAGRDRLVARMSGRALRGNYEAIRAQVPGQSILPMIKADAYGHGATWAARQLADLPDLHGFGVATLDEGRELRIALGPPGARKRKARIIVFSGSAPWSDAKGQLCARFGLTPVIATDPDWQLFLKGGWPGKLPYELKFNTGMNRLGLSLQSATSVARALRDRQAEWHPQGVLSHLAVGESPESRLSRTQRDRFSWLKRELSPAFPSTQFHFANSSGIWNSKWYRLEGLTDVVRPGISLYGVPPWPGAPARGILPVMCLEARVIQVQRLRTGETVGYGAAYRVDTSQPETIGILAAGYADGVHRALGSRGQVFVHGRRMGFAGAISMDLSAIRCPEGTRRGEWARILGPEIDPWAQAEAAGTIPYELLTSVSQRVQRAYE